MSLMEYHGKKGCYMGQEITARMKYRKIVKKSYLVF